MRLRLFGLVILSGLCLWGSWPMSLLSPLVFIALTPLLYAELLISENYKKSGRRVFGYTYLAFLIWNVATTWWVWYASEWGATAAIICNSLLMTIPVWLFHITKKNAGARIGYIALIFYWLGFEYLHLNWELTWPWLTLGNVFARTPWMVQWYEFTGVLGGSIWIWLSNILIFGVFINLSQNKLKNLIYPIVVIVIPIVLSLLLIPSTEELKSINKEKKELKVMVVQPNVDPYTEKFRYNARTGEANRETFIPYEEQMRNLLKVTEENLTPDIEYILWPETALPKGYWEKELYTYDVIKELQNFTKRSEVTLLTGADTYANYGAEKKTPTARYSPNIGYYDVFNTALLIDNKGRVTTYHKSKLVPGVERMPYPKLFSFLEVFAIDLGGVSGSLGEQEERTVLYSSDSVGVAPAICYESIFGDFVGRYFDRGAGFLGIVTNDGWWENTQGHRQHFEYARLRAIEHRTWVARSANTGISGFIDPYGRKNEILEWDREGVLIQKIRLTNRKTMYTRYGDYLGRVSAFIAIGILLSVVARVIMNRRKKAKA